MWDYKKKESKLTVKHKHSYFPVVSKSGCFQSNTEAFRKRIIAAGSSKWSQKKDWF